MGLNALVLADTHLRTGSPRWMPDAVLGHLRQVDVVLHAGDVLDAGVLARLAEEASAGRSPVPVYAVLGNNDLTLTGVLPHKRIVELEGVRIGMVHDSGRSAGREARLNRMFPDCQIVVFGHSHEPVDAAGVDGQRLFNPGSATQRRRQPVATFGLLRLEGGVVQAHAVLPT